MTPPPAVRDDPLWQVGVSLMSGGSLCKVGVVEFPAGINSKLLFVIVTMLNTIHDTLMPAENCTGDNNLNIDPHRIDHTTVHYSITV